MAKITALVPEDGAVKWVQPDPENNPEIEFCIKVVGARNLDQVASRSKVRKRIRNEKGKEEVVEEFSNERAAKAYGDLVFIDFKGLEDDDGTPLENTLENRQFILGMRLDYLNFVVDFAHTESNFVNQEEREKEKRFLRSSKNSKKNTTDTSQEQ